MFVDFENLVPSSNPEKIENKSFDFLRIHRTKLKTPFEIKPLIAGNNQVFQNKTLFYVKLFMVICLLLLARFQLGTSRNICSKSSSPTLSDLNRVSFKDSIYILQYKLRGWFIIIENTICHIFLQRKINAISLYICKKNTNSIWYVKNWGKRLWNT